MLDDPYWRAVLAYCRWQERGGYIHNQPNQGLSEVMDDDTGTTVLLNNINGHLATYRITDASSRMRRTWPPSQELRSHRAGLLHVEPV